MTLVSQISKISKKLYISGLNLRCPHCEQGRMFKSLFQIEETCAVCGVRFERRDGESIGGMAITMAIVPPLSLTGYFLTYALTDMPVWMNVAIWLVFIVVGCTWIYRHSRAAWVAVSYVTGGVYADAPKPDTTAEREQLVKAVRASRGESS